MLNVRSGPKREPECDTNEFNVAALGYGREWGSGVGVLEKLEIRFVQRVPHVEELPENVVEIYFRFDSSRMDAVIARQGYIASSSAVDAITDRVRRLADAAVKDSRPLAERIGLSPALSPDWREFLEALFQQNDSWAFFVQPARVLTSS